MLIGWNVSGWYEGMLLKGLVLVFTWPFEAKRVSWQNGLTKSCGKSAHPLQSVKTKYLAVSPVMDILSDMMLKLFKNLLIPISLS
jgi:hypothetical protein